MLCFSVGSIPKTPCSYANSPKSENLAALSTSGPGTWAKETLLAGAGSMAFTPSAITCEKSHP